MRYFNSRLSALLVAGLSFLAVPALRAQDAPTTLRGDVDGDGRVTRADADALRAYLVRGTLPAGRTSMLPVGDANADGRVTAADAALVSRFAAGVDVSRFPVGRPVEGGGERQPSNGTPRLNVEYECTVDVDSPTMSCQPATPQGVDGARLAISLGNPYVTVTGSGGVTYRVQPENEDTTTTNVAITSSISQPLGTTNGTNPHPDGTRLVITGLSVSTVKSGTVASATIRVDNADGTTTIPSPNEPVTHSNVPFYQYNGLLTQGVPSATKLMRLVYSSHLKTYKIKFVVSAPVQFEHGWVTIAPAVAPVIAPDSTTALTGTVYNQVDVVQADGITWSSSNTAVATVNASTGVVTGVAEGTTTITATSNVNAGRTGSRTVIVDKFPTVSSTTPANGAVGVLVTDNIVINFSEAVNVTGTAFTLECPAGSSQAFTVSGNGTSAITLNPDADLPAAVTCTVVVDGNQVTDADTNDGPNMMPGNHSFSFETAIQAIADAFGTTTTGNVRINSASTSPVFSVTTNDKITGSTTITFAGWNAVAGKTMGGGDVVMDTEGAGMGTFTYNPPAGFEGTDSLQYTITSGTASSSAKVALPVSGMIWFVNNGGAACTSRANGCGRLTHPYSSLAAFNAENNGTGNNPGAGDAVFLYESASAYTGPVTLLANQKLIGQDAGASLSTITGITPAAGSDALPAMNTGGNTVTIAGATGGVVLGADNLLRGFSLATTGGTALSGTGFGTPTIAEVPISATGGAALSLDNGTLNSTFPSVSSTNSTGRGISLTNVNGSPTFTAGSISGAAQAAFLVSGGNVGFTWPGTIGQANNAPLVDVQGSHTGTLTFSGALTATSGTGLQFNAAQGTYTFSGSATLNGGDAGIDITNGSGGTFNFNASTQITNPTGTGLNVYGSAPALVSFGGSITKNGTNAGRLVEIGEMTGGTVTFAVGSTLSSTSTAAGATGISLSNADGTVNFNGTTTLNGGDAGVDVLSGTGGTITFSATTSISNPSGIAFLVSNSSPSLTYPGTITANNGRAVEVSNTSAAACGTATFSGNLVGSGAGASGILVDRCNAGTLTFSGASKSFSTQGNAAVTITNNSATVNFTNGGLAITTTSGAGFSASGGGTVSVGTGAANNTINSTGGGTAVNINGATIGGSGVTFYSVNASGGGTNGIVLNNTGAGTFQVTGDGASDAANTTRGRTTAKSGGGTIALGSGGTITGKSGDAVSLSSTGAVVLRNMVIQNNSGDGVQASTSNGVTIDNTRITGHTDNSALFFTSVAAPVIIHSEMENNAFGAGAPGADIHNVRLISNTGTGSVQSSVIANTSAGAERQLQIFSTTGTLNIGVTNTRIAGSTVGDGVGVYAYGSSNITANFQNDSIHNNSAFGLDSGTETTQSSSLNITVNNTKFRDNFVGVTVAHGSSGTNTFNVTNNNFQNHGSVSVNINRLGAVGFTSFGLFSGTVSGNVIGTAGTANSGSPLGSNTIDVKTNGNGGTTQVAIVNNTIREIGNDGIRVIGRDANTGHTLHARIQNNNIANFHASALTGIRGELGAASGDKITMCLNISGNTVTNAPQNGVRVRSVSGGTPPPQVTLTMPAYDGTGATYLANQNPAATGLSGNTSFSNGNAGSTTSAGNCTTP
jgi:hypothetical protein